MAKKRAPLPHRQRDILRAAREVLSSDPRSPMSAVASAAGVGMSALYRNFPSKEVLLQAIVDEAETAYESSLQKAHEALDAGRDGHEVLSGFVLDLLTAGAATMNPRLPGMAGAGAQDEDRWKRLSDSNRALFDRVQAAGALREGVTFHDIGVLVFALGTVRGATAAETAVLQRRLTVAVMDGLRPVHGPLPGPGATRGDVYGTT